MFSLQDCWRVFCTNILLISTRFRYYNNRYLRNWLLRDSKEMGNSSRKIFETCSRLDLQDAINLVSKQNLANAMSPNHLTVNRFIYNYSKNGNPYNNNNNDVDEKNGSVFLAVPQNPDPRALLDPSQSLTTLFRSYTQSNLCALEPNGLDKSDLPAVAFLTSNRNSIEKDFNYDIGNIAYNPSLKDLKDAELHHILNDAMFKPFKKVNSIFQRTFFKMRNSFFL